jgi:RimJ/RimL family protein N-acetyltransferase
MTQPRLHTQRLSLVPLGHEHLPLEIELDSDPEVMRYLTGRARSAVEVQQLHRHRLAGAEPVPGLGFWAGFTGEDFVGWWILAPPEDSDRSPVRHEAELGYRVLRRHWRRGYASEGARELIRYGFTEIGLDRIFAQTLAVNAPSRATMAAVGMAFARSYVSAESDLELIPGGEHGEVEYELTRVTWQQRAASAPHPAEEQRDRETEGGDTDSDP